MCQGIEVADKIIDQTNREAHDTNSPVVSNFPVYLGVNKLSCSNSVLVDNTVGSKKGLQF
jgi:hypothetical protein